MKLVIGTRTFLGDDWTHLDIQPGQLHNPGGMPKAVDIVADARKIPLEDQTCEVVYSQECLEHIPWGEYQTVLAEWARLVAPGGELRIEVPDFLAACRQVLEVDTLEMDRAIQQIIFGGQSNTFDFHYMGLTPRMLTDDMERLGLKVIEVKRGWEHGWLLVVGRRP